MFCYATLEENTTRGVNGRVGDSKESYVMNFCTSSVSRVCKELATLCSGWI